MSILKKGFQLSRNEMKSILGGTVSPQVCAVICVYRFNELLMRGCPEGLQCMTVPCTNRPGTGKACTFEMPEES